MTEQEIFLEALEMTTPEARAAYLQGACGRDVTLRRKVDELLEFREVSWQTLLRRLCPRWEASADRNRRRRTPGLERRRGQNRGESERTHELDHDDRSRARWPDVCHGKHRPHARPMGCGHAKGAGPTAGASRTSLVGGHVAGRAHAGLKCSGRDDEVMGCHNAPPATRASRMLRGYGLFVGQPPA